MLTATSKSAARGPMNPGRTRPRPGALLVLLALAAPMASAQVSHSIQVTRLTSDSTLRQGGGGGIAYNLSCAAGQVLVGLNAAAGLSVDRIQGVCSATSAGNWTGPLTFTATTGGPSGFAANRMCPANFAISGFSGRAASVIDRLVLECTRLAAGGTFNTTVARQNLGAIGGGGGTAFGVTRCTNPARAIVGRSGLLIDSFELACEDDTPLMTTADIDGALAGAETMLRTDSGTLDVTSDVRFSRNGIVRIEPSNGLFDINSATEIGAACLLPGFAVVTSSLSFCDGAGSPIGCATAGCMIVVPFGNGLGRNALWAHEFGHTRALQHRTGATLLMNPTINNTGDINNVESDAFENLAVAFFSGFLPSETEADPALPVEKFVEQLHVHGVPYAQAASYGPAAVPMLAAILRDPRWEPRWSNAATVLSVIGDPTAVDAVIEFIRDPGAGEVTAERQWMRGNAVLSLGYAANRGNAKAMQYLQYALDPGAWQQLNLRGRRGRNADAAVDDDESDDELLSERAALGLALSGRPEAKAALEAKLRGPARSLRHQQALQSALAEHAKVAAKGLRGYDLDRQTRAATRAEAARNPPHSQ